MVIVIAGPPCAGKSTIAAEAARRLAERGFDPERPDLTAEIVRRSAAGYRYGSGVVIDTEEVGVEGCVEAVVRLAG